MKAIVEYTDVEYKNIHDKYERLREATLGVSRDELLPDLQRNYGYAHYKFRGAYSEKLVERLGHEPDADEIIMLVDGGFSHFGATCTIDHATRRFSGRVNTD